MSFKRANIDGEADTVAVTNSIDSYYKMRGDLERFSTQFMRGISGLDIEARVKNLLRDQVDDLTATFDNIEDQLLQ